MCGIAGYLNLDGAPAARAVVRRMTDAIKHRGPDGEGFWVEGPVALGHRRLAIIDLTDGGRQPMETEDERFVITYNGELYNYEELKAELSAHGRRFRSASDTEVLLVAVQHWGLEEALRRFNGMFAFALWDARERTLTLARDRFGVKPLYWMRARDGVLFGSEVKALLAHPQARALLDVDGLAEYLTFQNFHSDRTLFAGAKMLPAASHVTIAVGEGPLPEPTVYHRLRFAEDPGDSREEGALAEELEHLFRQAVSRQMIADVDLGCYLSGGIDSGAITGAAAGLVGHLRTFTCGFDMSSASGLELYFDERRDAELMSARLHTEHYEMVLKAGDMERAIPDLVWHLEEPRVGQCYPNFLVSGLASKFNKVVLGGTGGDELFGGYPWRYAAAEAAGPAGLADATFRSWQRLIPPEDQGAAFAPMRGELSGPSARDVFDGLFEDPGPGASAADRANAVMTYEAGTFLRGLLVVDDKVAMAHGLEGRVPFLDNDLADFAARLPLRHKVGPGAPGANGGRTSEGKRLLRRAVSGLVPPEVMTREKQGFSAPDASWFKGQSIDYVRERIGGPRARVYQFLDHASVDARLQEHFAGARNHRLLIWSLLHLEQAMETWRLA